MNAYHVTMRLADGQRRALQIIAASTMDAILAAQHALGDTMRGASAKPMVLAAPGLVGLVGRPVPAANDEHFGRALA